jgi:hypothetical protein
MSLVGKLNISQSDISQEIDLADLGFNIPNNAELKFAIAQSMVNAIVDRTLSNKDAFGSNFTSYSKEYINSLEFQAYDKSAGDVNLKLTGEMLDSIEVASTSGNKVVIRVTPDQAAKAFNHITGDTVKKRNFFGITEKEINKIKKEFRSSVNDNTQAIDNKVLKLLGALGELLK